MLRRENRYACIHGHFYQPPRENPWLEFVEVQDSAAPYHDWNARVHAECYAANAAARLQTSAGRLTAIVRNYDRISFNFGPTLLAWMQRADPRTCAEIADADRESALRLGGHGNALAQVYNHVILPLASPRDRATQVRWGIADFRARFGREPEGLWLSETAVDTPTLETLAEHGIRFTVLSPRQAAAVAPLEGDEWLEVTEGTVDTTVPYRCDLPSGRSIALFFYDGSIAPAVAFGGLLDDGGALAERLAASLPAPRVAEGPRLAHVATDGESYGHHHRFGDMALAYALRSLEERHGVTVTNYGRFLELCPPAGRARIRERSSWSCAHGVERWRSDCGCHVGGGPGWTQAWRAPLREALDGLKERLDAVFEAHGGRVLADPWAARDAYVSVVLDRSPANIDRFLARHGRGPLDAAGRTAALRALELQRAGMLMFTSCGWFFDDISGIEAVQVLQYACRAAQLARDLAGEDGEGPLVAALGRAASNLPSEADGASIWARRVRPAVVDLRRVAAHQAIAGALDGDDADGPREVYAYAVRRLEGSSREHSGTRLALGRFHVVSRLTLEEDEVTVGLLHFGGHDFRCSVRGALAAADFRRIRDDLCETYERRSLSDAVTALARHFGEDGSFTLRDAFLEERRRILDKVVAGTLAELEAGHRRFYREHGHLLTYLAEANYPLPEPFRMAVGFALAAEVEALAEATADPAGRPPEALQALAETAGRLAARAAAWGARLPADRLRSVLTGAVIRQIDRFGDRPGAPLLATAHLLLDLARDLHVDLDVWRVQNAAFRALTEPTWTSRAEPPTPAAREELSREALRLAERLQFALERVSRG